jgi:NaMN:DMB phosphoribosyltransferase
LTAAVEHIGEHPLGPHRRYRDVIMTFCEATGLRRERFKIPADVLAGMADTDILAVVTIIIR